MNIVNRPKYLEQLIEHKDKDVIKIITGIRRCGKSTLLQLFHDYLITNGIKELNIIHINFESLKYSKIKNYMDIYMYIKSKINEKDKTYLLFDEIQNIEKFERAIESFRLDFNVDIYLTGSNAYFLSSKFATILTGRYVEIKMLPLSFSEFLEFNILDNENIEDKFQKYLKYGGFPLLTEYKFNSAGILQALEGIYATVILKDILQNVDIQKNTLTKIVKFLMSNIGNISSPNNIGKVLSNEEDGLILKIAGKTIVKYIDLLKNAYIFYEATRYDIKGKQHLKTLSKIYVCDIGLRNMILGYRDVDRGHILENIVYLELLRRGYTVYVGKIGELEIDFIAEKVNTKIYIQVAETIQYKEAFEREIKSLKSIKDNYPKLILTMDKSFIESYEGIMHENIIEWLKKE